MAPSTSDNRDMTTSTHNTNDPVTRTANITSAAHRSTSPVANYGTMSSHDSRPSLPLTNTTTPTPNPSSAANNNDPPRPPLTRAATDSTALKPITTPRPNLLRRISSHITAALELSTSNSPANQNRPTQPSHWTNHAHHKAFLQLWDSTHEAAAHEELPKLIKQQLADVEKEMLLQFPELREGDVALGSEWMEYTLGVALRHPFCAEGGMGRWEVLAGPARVGGGRGWGHW